MADGSCELTREQIIEMCEARAREEKEILDHGKHTGAQITDRFRLDCLRCNTLGDGLLFAQRLREKYLHNALEAGWLRWSGHHWVDDITNRALADVEIIAEEYLKLLTGPARVSDDDPKDEIKRKQKLQREILRRVQWLRSEKGRTSTLKFAAANPVFDLTIMGTEIDQHPMKLPCPNGVINLLTGELEPGNQTDYLKTACPTEFHGFNDPAPELEHHLAVVFDKDELMIGYIRRLLGYCITGLTTERIFPLWRGGGFNGKGVLVEAIKHVLGDLAGPISAEMLLNQKNARSSAAPSPDIMSLRGRRFIWASETDDNRRFSTSTVKWLTGSDTLVGRAAHAPFPTTFRPTHKLILMTNEIPAASADDMAFWRRVHLVDFRLTFVEGEPTRENERPMDKGILDKLKAEASGILAWLVRGCLEWQQRGLDPPPAVFEATASQRALDDFIGEWVAECTARVPGAMTETSMLYKDIPGKSFEPWYLENWGSKVPTMKAFTMKMARRFERGHHPVTRKSIFRGIELL